MVCHERPALVHVHPQVGWISEMPLNDLRKFVCEQLLKQIGNMHWDNEFFGGWQYLNTLPNAYGRSDIGPMHAAHCIHVPDISVTHLLSKVVRVYELIFPKLKFSSRLIPTPLMFLATDWVQVTSQNEHRISVNLEGRWRWSEVRTKVKAHVEWKMKPNTTPDICLFFTTVWCWYGNKGALHLAGDGLFKDHRHLSNACVTKLGINRFNDPSQNGIRSTMGKQEFPPAGYIKDSSLPCSLDPPSSSVRAIISAQLCNTIVLPTRVLKFLHVTSHLKVCWTSNDGTRLPAHLDDFLPPSLGFGRTDTWVHRTWQEDYPHRQSKPNCHWPL